MNGSKNADQSGTNESEPPARAGTAWWRLPLLLAVVLVAIVAARSARVAERGPTTHVRSAPPAAIPSGKFVSLVINYGGGRERKFDAIPWHEGMNVDDVMIAASELPNGITYDITGDHEMTMVTRIDDTYNMWGRLSNWTYKVNDVPADRSMKVFELQPGDRVLWTFGPRQ
jgi:hypothetical protein